ncbi:hypothetical protein NL676_009267 [Syzygium grande]|nr:hypothetical protein NL676_009267 [Syzygium grande]
MINGAGRADPDVLPPTIPRPARAGRNQRRRLAPFRRLRGATGLARAAAARGADLADVGRVEIVILGRIVSLK